MEFPVPVERFPILGIGVGENIQRALCVGKRVKRGARLFFIERESLRIFPFRSRRSGIVPVAETFKNRLNGKTLQSNSAEHGGKDSFIHKNSYRN